MNTRGQIWALGLLLASCGGSPTDQPRAAVAATSAATSARLAAPEPKNHFGTPGGESPALTAQFQAHLKRHPELDFDGLRKQLELTRQPDEAIGFDPTAAKYYPEIVDRLKLTKREQEIYRRRGMVSVDHVQRYSMASAYYAIYARDLPLLVTTDSILHAFHRSFDFLLGQMEEEEMLPGLQRSLAQVHGRLPSYAQAGHEQATDDLSLSLADVDLYLTVALNLLKGAGGAAKGPDKWDGKLRVHSGLGQDRVAEGILHRVASLRMESPMNGCADCTNVYGGRRAIDWSQFAPRGHYTKKESLRRYFRAMMWLGRADTGFTLSSPDTASNLQARVEREQRDALILGFAVRDAKQADTVELLTDKVDYLVGGSDGLGAKGIQRALDALAIENVGQIGAKNVAARFTKLLPGLGANQSIRSQALGTVRGAAPTTKLHMSFQLFGQRFTIDSFVLSQVVYDSIHYHGNKVERMMPKGLDVMAALGNDEAVALLESEIGKFPYASSLLAARRTVDDLSKGYWSDSVYAGWLGALRQLHRVSDDAHLPRVMKTRAWQHKQLQTQLASWAELRHDTVLYTKQSFTGVLGCLYPEGYVEPYPEFFEEMAQLAIRWRVRLATARGGPATKATRGFLDHFVAATTRLAALAKKELKREQFTASDLEFLRGTINRHSIGSGGQQRYTGWYAKLISDGPAEKWAPTVADVHSGSGAVLEVGVGDAQFMVVAIDKGCGQTAYVGPSYSYYEFRQPAADRMTDESWAARIRAEELPPRPDWSTSFVAPPKERDLSRYNSKRNVKRDKLRHQQASACCDALKPSAERPKGSAAWFYKKAATVCQQAVHGHKRKSAVFAAVREALKDGELPVACQ